ncbi:zinc finger CCCH domain-containing protein 66-like [Salvia divinorum]|uniref:Zinc finger CCCH domain-containing protein 66-like n=1 Tax=Salvia divinorum TaxID=28513 RepID=A0ABD1I4F6_SALDI
MPGNRKFSRNGSTSDRVEVAMRRLQVEESGENGGVDGELGSYPDRPGEPDCIYYLRMGSCGYGNNCRFNHPSSAGQVDGVKTSNELPERVGQPDCGHYLKTGTCKYGSTCRYHHPKDRQADFSLNMLGFPMRQDAKPCPFYMRTGLCKYRYTCKFNHPQPILYTYMRNASPLSVTSVLTGPVLNGHLPVSYLPERPDQPECRYFMEHGNCKYGPECKYHHPREKFTQLLSTSLGPLGLPLRPGQPACSYYSMYGICKYGPTCIFDHPMDGHNYTYSLCVPPPAFAYLSPTPYQSTSLPVADISRAKSSKLSDGIKKEATANNKQHQNSNAKSLGESLDQSDSLPNSSKASVTEALSPVTLQSPSQ